VPERNRTGRLGSPLSLSVALAAVLVLAAAAARAHGLEVFAYAEGAYIHGSAHFHGGGQGAVRILIRDAAGNALAELAPAADGSFTYRAREPVAHLIVAESADGHRARWRVNADELRAGFPSPTKAVTDAAGSSSRPNNAGRAAAGGPVDLSSSGDSALHPATEAAIAGAVARQIGPLRQELAHFQQGVRLRDILGGIGYIVGIAGLALWWRSRRPERER
jgi:nickel transport protein